MSKKVNILVLLAFCLMMTMSQSTIRIVEGIEKFSDNHLRYDASLFYGPDILHLLNGQCFSKSHERQEYVVCPFQNITSRRVAGSQRSTLIGIWANWVFDEDTITDSQHNLAKYSKMQYLDGQSCGSKTKSAVVEIQCDQSSSIGIYINKIIEQTQCDYKFDLVVPYSCDLFVDDIVDVRQSKETKPISATHDSGTGKDQSNTVISSVINASEHMHTSCTCNSSIGAPSVVINETDVVQSIQSIVREVRASSNSNPYEG